MKWAFLKIKTKEISDSVFKTRQKRIVDTELMIYDSPSNVLNWIMDQENEYEYHKEFMNPSEFIEQIKRMEFDEVIDIANEVYDWNNVNIGVVTKEDANQVQQQVESIWKKITT